MKRSLLFLILVLTGVQASADPAQWTIAKNFTAPTGQVNQLGSLNNVGDVLFYGTEGDGFFNPITRTAYVSNGNDLTAIGSLSYVRNLPGFGTPSFTGKNFDAGSLNDAGQVAFQERTYNSTSALYLYSDGSLSLIADDIYSINTRQAINNDGKIVFGKSGDLWLYDGSTAALYADLPNQYLGRVSINDAGDVFLRPEGGVLGTKLFYIPEGGALTEITGPVGPGSGSTPSVNNESHAAYFDANFDLQVVDNMGNQIETYDAGDDRIVATFINDIGTIGFVRDFSNVPGTPREIYVSFGGGYYQEVLGQGDEFLGSTINTLFYSEGSLNNLNQLAVGYSLANGTSGVAVLQLVAPVPEASSLTLTAVAVAMVTFGWRKRRHAQNG